MLLSISENISKISSTSFPLVCRFSILVLPAVFSYFSSCAKMIFFFPQPGVHDGQGDVTRERLVAMAIFYCSLRACVLLCVSMYLYVYMRVSVFVEICVWWGVQTYLHACNVMTTAVTGNTTQVFCLQPPRLQTLTQTSNKFPTRVASEWVCLPWVGSLQLPSHAVIHYVSVIKYVSL